MQVSVIIPARNEEGYIGGCLNSLLNQDYPEDDYEVLVVDGRSTDNTRPIIESIQRKNSNVRLLDNPEKIMPCGVNKGLKESTGGVIIFLSGHSMVSPDFIRKNVEHLKEAGADCVGGRIDTVGGDGAGEAISWAMSSPFGVGNSFFRYGSAARFVDTVAFGAYRREVFEKIGLLDEEMVRDQDDEFNYRLIRNGGKIFFTPEIKSSYFCRPALKKLWSQYFQYGLWKVRVIQKQGRVFRLRHLIPSIFVLALAAGFAGGLLWRPALVFGLVVLIAYLAASVFFSIRIGIKNRSLKFWLLPWIFAILHISYGSGFWAGLVKFRKGFRGNLSPGGLYPGFYCKERKRRFNEVLTGEGFLPLTGKRILDMGCGSGDVLDTFRELGADSAGLVGLDLSEERISNARRIYPGFSFVEADGKTIPFPDAHFDLISQCTVFTSVLKWEDQKRIAGEMLRVLKPGGLIIWYDMIFTKPFNRKNRGLGKRKIRALFPGCRMNFRSVTLNPVLARVLIKISSRACEVLENVFFLRGFYLASIRKVG